MCGLKTGFGGDWMMPIWWCENVGFVWSFVELQKGNKVLKSADGIGDKAKERADGCWWCSSCLDQMGIQGLFSYWIKVGFKYEVCNALGSEHAWIVCQVAWCKK